jgi:hypothetical protein
MSNNQESSGFRGVEEAVWSLLPVLGLALRENGGNTSPWPPPKRRAQKWAVAGGSITARSLSICLVYTVCLLKDVSTHSGSLFQSRNPIVWGWRRESFHWENISSSQTRDPGTCSRRVNDITKPLKTRQGRADSGAWGQGWPAGRVPYHRPPWQLHAVCPQSFRQERLCFGLCLSFLGCCIKLPQTEGLKMTEIHSI